jgi:4-amino-4-deoxy-L-arabinose transferase-like glycosyltransferase
MKISRQVKLRSAEKGDAGMKRLRPYLPAIGIFCLAVLVAVVYNLTVARDYYGHPLHDSLTYQTIAFHLLDERCFCLASHVTTVSRAPLWPFLIAGLSLVVGREDIFDRLFLCIVNAVTCVFIYLLARDLFGKRTGLIAGIFACFYPALYVYTGWLYTEALFTFFQTAICYCVFRIQRSGGRDWRLWILCGILLCLLSLTRPNGLLVIGLVAVWAAILFWRGSLPRNTLLGAVLCVGVACALIAPWTIRNYVVSGGGFVPVAGGDGTVLIGSYNDIIMTNRIFLGSWYVPPRNVEPLVGPPIPPGPCAARCEVLVQQEETAAALKWVRSHLDEIPLLMFYHVRNFLTPYTHEADMPMNRFSSQLPSIIALWMSQEFPIPVLLLSAVGLVVTRRKYWRELVFAYLVILGTVADILVFYGNARFRSPIEPLLILLAAGAIWWLTDSGPGTRRDWWANRQKRYPAGGPVLMSESSGSAGPPAGS